MWVKNARWGRRVDNKRIYTENLITHNVNLAKFFYFTLILPVFKYSYYSIYDLSASFQYIISFQVNLNSFEVRFHEIHYQMFYLKKYKANMLYLLNSLYPLIDPLLNVNSLLFNAVSGYNNASWSLT